MMWYDHGSWGAGDWAAMGVTMLVFWGAVIAFVVWLVRGGRSSQPAPSPSRTPDDVLAERFAKGEIGEDEFIRRRELLHADTSPRS